MSVPWRNRGTPPATLPCQTISWPSRRLPLPALQPGALRPPPAGCPQSQPQPQPWSRGQKVEHSSQDKPYGGNGKNDFRIRPVLVSPAGPVGTHLKGHAQLCAGMSRDCVIKLPGVVVVLLIRIFLFYEPSTLTMYKLEQVGADNQKQIFKTCRQTLQAVHSRYSKPDVCTY